MLSLSSQRIAGILAGTILVVTLLFMVISASLGGPGAHASPAATSIPPPPHVHTHFTVSHQAQVGISLMDAPANGNLTGDQLKAFAESHVFVGGDVIGGGNPKVASITLLTAQDYQQRVGISLTLPANEPLALVELTGPFHLTRVNAPSPEAAKMARVSVDRVYEVIDLTTGNLQAWAIA